MRPSRQSQRKEPPNMTFPLTRFRRTRRTQAMRNLIAETQLHPNDFIYPLFITERDGEPTEISSMPGVFQQNIDHAIRDVNDALRHGIEAVMLFGIPDGKDPEATQAWDDDGVIQRAVRKLKDEFGDQLVVITDTCLCEYMNHGHCGIAMDGQVLNDPSAELLGKVAAAQAMAGADIVAPSAMMDGQVAFIRDYLDEAGYDHVPILAYSTKYASSLYGPFRDAAESPPAFGNRSTYQMDARNRREGIREMMYDIAESADMVMVKPAMFYLDVIKEARDAVDHPIFAYSVSGEYAMIKAAVEQGWLDEKPLVLEHLTSIKRAGADKIITYYAKTAAQWLKG